MPHILHNKHVQLSFAGMAIIAVTKLAGVASTIFRKIICQTSEHLRLAPAMHGNVIPAEMQTTRAERTVALDPPFKDLINYRPDRLLQVRKRLTQDEA